MDEPGRGRPLDDPPIVVGYDGSPASDAAARWAAGTAHRAGRRVRMVHAMPWPVLRSAGGTVVLVGRDALGRAAERLLDKVCRHLRAAYPGVPIEAEVAIGDPVPILLRAGTGALLLVLGSRGLGEVCELTEGSVMTHLATHAACPVVVVPAGWSARAGDVVVGVDGSARGVNAIGVAFRFAEQTGAAVRAVLAWHDPQSTGPGDMRFPVHDLVALEEDSATVLGEAVAGHAVEHPDVKTAEKLVHGLAAKVLVDESRDAGLLVVGSHGRGGSAACCSARSAAPSCTEPPVRSPWCGSPTALARTGRSALPGVRGTADGGGIRVSVDERPALPQLIDRWVADGLVAGRYWHSLTDGGRLGIVGGAAVALLLAGFGVPEPAEPASVRLRSVLWLLPRSA